MKNAKAELTIFVLALILCSKIVCKF